jgi:hypothetical protein
MGTERRKQLMLAALLAVLAFVGYRAMEQTSAPAATASNQRTQATPGSRGDGVAPAAGPDVHLQALDDARPKPVAAGRNLFRFKPKAPPPPPPGSRTAAAVPVGPPPPVAPPGPAPPPPITLKFIGVVEQPDGKPKIGVLSDSQGHVFYGSENGPPIEGRYRILRIGLESIEMSYLDGRGRQTIRLTGS